METGAKNTHLCELAPEDDWEYPHESEIMKRRWFARRTAESKTEEDGRKKWKD